MAKKKPSQQPINLEEAVRAYKELQMAEKVLKQQKEDVQAAITAEMEALGKDEMQVDVFTVRYKEVVSQKFDSTAFKVTHKDLYEQYCKPVPSHRFTIT